MHYSASLTAICKSNRCSLLWITRYAGHLCILDMQGSEQNGRYSADDILECICVNENFQTRNKISSKYVLIDNKSALVQVMTWRVTRWQVITLPNDDQDGWRHMASLVIKENAIRRQEHDRLRVKHWLVGCSAPNHYLKQTEVFVIEPCGTDLWIKMFTLHQRNAFENAVYKMSVTFLSESESDCRNQ